MFGSPIQLLKEPRLSETKKVLPKKKEQLPPLMIRHLEGQDWTTAKHDNAKQQLEKENLSVRQGPPVGSMNKK